MATETLCGRCGARATANAVFIGTSFHNFPPGHLVFETGVCECGGRVGVWADERGAALFDGRGRRVRMAIQEITSPLRTSSELNALAKALSSAKTLAVAGDIEDAKRTLSVAAPWLPNLFAGESQPTESTAFTRWLIVVLTAITLAVSAARELRERADSTPSAYVRVREQAIERYESGAQEIIERPTSPPARLRYLSAGEVRDVLFANGGAREVSDMTGIPFRDIVNALECGASGFEGYILGALYDWSGGETTN